MAAHNTNEGIQQFGGGTIQNSGTIAVGRGAVASPGASASQQQPETPTPKPSGHQTFFCVDVEGFGDRRRGNLHQVAVRAGLYKALEAAFNEEQLPWDSCYHEDRGDSVMILLPPEFPKRRIADVPHRLAEKLVTHNQLHSSAAQIRLRVALHAGEVHQDDHGVAGTALNFTFRLLDAPPLKRALAHSPGVLAVIVSDWYHTEVLQHDPACHPEEYAATEITVKETTATAWIRPMAW